MPDEISRRTLIVAIVACAVLLVSVPAAVMFFSQHHESRLVSPEAAEAEFAQLRARFAGQRPLLDMGARHVVEPAAGDDSTRRATSLHAFHTVILDTRGRAPRLLHLTAPCGFARLFAHRDGVFRWLGELTFLDDTEFDPEPIQLPFGEISRHGPGLIVDYRHAGGGQFIAWVE
ncbi:MAG TPA: hypothetical protein VGY48_18125 [Vicinamibacterales bacterium]|jgi:hypothetical protein|nr:hypothetical protein [Vicinamibacterales bacterium]